MITLADLTAGARVLDMGAGSGEAVRLMQALGYDAHGIDLEPRSGMVAPGDFLHLPYADTSFDAVLSQCAFFVSGDVPGALREARRVLKPGGTLMLSDVFFEAPASAVEAAGFELLQLEDMTDAWREYYLEALWQGEDCGCVLPRGKCKYWLLIARKV
ncbi:MAG: class I SAM-dependent methyltransferase [Oscillospiraceae bacterium]|nr:class I SAM-dependent methyltransferase [Oscillospiraceae bacterium]